MCCLKNINSYLINIGEPTSLAEEMLKTNIKISNVYGSLLGKRIVFLNTQNSDVTVCYLNWGLYFSVLTILFVSFTLELAYLL